MCYSCQHYDDTTPELVCAAFPEGIPEGIIESKVDHRNTLRGEPTFLQRPDAPEPDWEQIVPEEMSVVASLRARAHGLVAAASKWDTSEVSKSSKYRKKWDESKVERDTDPGEEGQFAKKGEGKKKKGSGRQSARDRALAEAKEKGYKVTEYEDGSVFIHSPDGGKGFGPPAKKESFEEFDRKRREKAKTPKQKQDEKTLRAMRRDFDRQEAKKAKDAERKPNPASDKAPPPMPKADDGKDQSVQGKIALALKTGKMPTDIFDTPGGVEDFMKYADSQGWETSTNEDGATVVLTPWGPMTLPRKKNTVKASGWTPKDRLLAVANGWALPDGSFPVRDVADWDKALVASAKASNPDTIRRHLVKRGRELGIPDAEKRALTAASLRKWDPLLHPRGRDGKFINKGGWIQGVIEWLDGTGATKSAGRVSDIRPNTSDPDDPLIIVKSRSGAIGEILASQASEAVGPKADLSNGRDISVSVSSVNRSGMPDTRTSATGSYTIGWGDEMLMVKDTGGMYDIDWWSDLGDGDADPEVSVYEMTGGELFDWISENLPPEYFAHFVGSPVATKIENQAEIQMAIDEAPADDFGRTDLGAPDLNDQASSGLRARDFRDNEPVTYQGESGWKVTNQRLSMMMDGGGGNRIFIMKDGKAIDVAANDVFMADRQAPVADNFGRTDLNDDRLRDQLRARVHGVGVGQAFTPVERGATETDIDFHRRVFADGQEKYKPVSAVEAAGAAYRRSIGLPEPSIPTESWTDLAAPWPHYERIGAGFERLESNPNDPAVKAAYADLVKQTQAQMKVLEDMGIRVEYLTPEEIIDRGLDPNGLNPYLTADAQAQDVRVNKRLMIASLGPYTEAHHPLLDSSVGGAYDQFRAVHDAFGHTAIGADFTRHGEYQAWLHHLSMFSGPARRAASTELTGENSFLVTRRQPAPHKAALLPVIFDPWDEFGSLQPAFYSPDGGDVVAPEGVVAPVVMASSMTAIPTPGDGGPGLAELLGYEVPADRLDMIDNMYGTYGVVKPRDILMGAVRLAQERAKA